MGTLTEHIRLSQHRDGLQWHSLHTRYHESCWTIETQHQHL